MNPLIAIVVLIAVVFALTVLVGSPYVPSRRLFLMKALEDFSIDSSDYLIDLGSGDGVVLRAAANRGARALGYEINPLLFWASCLLSIGYKKINIHLANYWFQKLPKDVTVIYVFTASRDVTRLTRYIQNEANRLGHSIRLISLGSDFSKIKPIKTSGPYYLYSFDALQPKEA